MTGTATVVVRVPEPLLSLGVWTVRTPGEAGPPGVPLAAPPGPAEVVVEVDARRMQAGLAATGRLVIRVDLDPGEERTLTLPWLRYPPSR
jgi:hypothetical protein